MNITLSGAALFLMAFYASEAKPTQEGSNVIAAEVVGPGAVSLPTEPEFGACLSHDQRTIYFTRGNNILISHRRNNEWSKPYIAPFNSDKFDGAPFLSHDESKLYFMSERIVPGKTATKEQPANHWFVEMNADDEWSEAKLIPPPVSNMAAMDGFVSLTDRGTMYFFSKRAGGHGSHDIYRSRQLNGQFLPPELLASPINTEFGDGHPYNSGDER